MTCHTEGRSARVNRGCSNLCAGLRRLLGRSARTVSETLWKAAEAECRAAQRRHAYLLGTDRMAGSTPSLARAMLPEPVVARLVTGRPSGDPDPGGPRDDVTGRVGVAIWGAETLGEEMPGTRVS